MVAVRAAPLLARALTVMVVPRLPEVLLKLNQSALSVAVQAPVEVIVRLRLPLDAVKLKVVGLVET